MARIDIPALKSSSVENTNGWFSGVFALNNGPVLRNSNSHSSSFLKCFSFIIGTLYNLHKAEGLNIIQVDVPTKKGFRYPVRMTCRASIQNQAATFLQIYSYFVCGQKGAVANDILIWIRTQRGISPWLRFLWFLHPCQLRASGKKCRDNLDITEKPFPLRVYQGGAFWLTTFSQPRTVIGLGCQNNLRDNDKSHLIPERTLLTKVNEIRKVHRGCLLILLSNLFVVMIKLGSAILIRIRQSGDDHTMSLPHQSKNMP